MNMAQWKIHRFWSKSGSITYWLLYPGPLLKPLSLSLQVVIKEVRVQNSVLYINVQNTSVHICTQMYRTDFWTLCEKARVGCSQRTASKHVYHQGWNRSPAQVGCMRQVLGPGALGRPRGMGWRGRWEGGSGWGAHVNPWLIHVNVWQNPLQYCKVISKNKNKNKQTKRK